MPYVWNGGAHTADPAKTQGSDRKFTGRGFGSIGFGGVLLHFREHRILVLGSDAVDVVDNEPAASSITSK